MYQYTEFDRQFVKARAAQYRDQLTRWQAGLLPEEEFRPLRLQNGWYVQRYAPMLRVAVPYGELSSAQLRVLATIARDFDQPDLALIADAQAAQDQLGAIPVSNGQPVHSRLGHGYAHFTTRQNVQYNWIPLGKSADVMDLLASVNMHGIQTSGNCIRNITSDERAGIAADEIADPRPFAEIMRQWSTLHPELAFLPRKFKIAITGAHEDRAATAWHDVGLHMVVNASGETGFKVLVGGGMGRTPIVATTIRDFLPWNQILNTSRRSCGPTTALAAATISTRRVSRFWSKPKASNSLIRSKLNTGISWRSTARRTPSHRPSLTGFQPLL